MVQHPEPKKAVALIRSAFAAKGVRLQHKEACNLLAQLWGYRDWPTYRGMNPAENDGKSKVGVLRVPFGRQEHELHGWYTWVVCSRSSDHGEELWVLPQGATLQCRLGRHDEWTFVHDDDAVPLTVGFTDPSVPCKSWQDVVVATSVACEYPRADRYGIPVMANEREVAAWLEQDLGWGYLASPQGGCLVDVITRETGDDTGERWWVELLVSPEVHERLVQQFNPENIAFEQVWPTLDLGSPYLQKSKANWDPRSAALYRDIGWVFADSDGATLGEVLNVLTRFPGEVASMALQSHLDKPLLTLDPKLDGMTCLDLHRRLIDAIERAEKASSR